MRLAAFHTATLSKRAKRASCTIPILAEQLDPCFLCLLFSTSRLGGVFSRQRFHEFFILVQHNTSEEICFSGSERTTHILSSSSASVHELSHHLLWNNYLEQLFLRYAIKSLRSFSFLIPAKTILVPCYWKRWRRKKTLVESWKIHWGIVSPKFTAKERVRMLCPRPLRTKTFSQPIST